MPKKIFIQTYWTLKTFEVTGIFWLVLYYNLLLFEYICAVIAERGFVSHINPLKPRRRIVIIVEKTEIIGKFALGGKKTAHAKS